jgi:hypothetical protein
MADIELRQYHWTKSQSLLSLLRRSVLGQYSFTSPNGLNSREEVHSTDVFVALLAETQLTVIKSEIRVVVLQNIGCWTKAPTIGILVGNTRIDEVQIGASYNELESTMNI